MRVKARTRLDARSLDRTLFVVALAVLGFTIAYPSARMALQALGNWEWRALTSTGGYIATRNTIVISFLTVAASGVLGTTLAFLLNRFSFPGRDAIAAMALLPFALPPLVGVLSFYYLIGRDGFVPRFLEHAAGLEGWHLRGPAAILLVHTYSFYVFFYAMVSSALETMDRAPMEAARTLGASPWRVFTRVTLPMLRPALTGAALLAFMSSGASFSAPLIFGEDYSMLSVRIVQARDQFNHADAYTLTVVLALVSLMGVVVFRSSRKGAGTASKGVSVPVRSKGGRVLAGLLAAACGFVLILPHLTIFYLSFADFFVWNEQILPPSLTFGNYMHIFNDAEELMPIWNSAWTSGLAAAVTLAVALPAGYLIARGRPGSRMVNFLVMIPWALPGTVIAMNLIVAFNDPWMPLYGTVWMLPLAYYVRNVPLLTRISSAAIEPFDASLIEAARTLGARPFFCFVHVAVPLLMPAIAAGAVLVFAMALGEFVASRLLYTPANIPISMQVYMAWSGSQRGSAFAYSVFLMVLVAAVFYMSRRFTSRIL